MMWIQFDQVSTRIVPIYTDTKGISASYMLKDASVNISLNSKYIIKQIYIIILYRCVGLNTIFCTAVDIRIIIENNILACLISAYIVECTMLRPTFYRKWYFYFLLLHLFSVCVTVGRMYTCSVFEIVIKDVLTHHYEHGKKCSS